MDDVATWTAISLLYGGGLVCFVARVRFGLPRYGVVWWTGVGVSAVGFLGLLAIGYFSR
jgi:hypothetical protein